MELVIRIGVLYLVLMVVFRLMGKRELGTMSPFELVTLLLIPEIMSAAVNRGDDSMTNALVGVTTLVLLVLVTSLITFRSKRLECVIEGEATVLVSGGVLLETNLARERVTPGEVFSEMHKAGLFDLAQVRWAILEADGKITVIPVAAHDPGRRRDDNHVV